MGAFHGRIIARPRKCIVRAMLREDGMLESTRFDVPYIPEITMKNPLDSLWGTVISGLVLTVVLYYLARMMMGG
jgi:hypothetical protein